jgi:hypothetical protein
MSLTDGIIGCWSPSLGASGYRLLDRSGRGNHGTLTNMDAGTDWTGTPVGLALDYDGSNDVVVANVPPGAVNAATCSLTMWYRRKATSALSAFFGFGVPTFETNRIAIQSWSDGVMYISTDAGTWGQFNSNDLNWHHIAVSFDGGKTGNASRLIAWHDGVQQTLTFSGTIGATTGSPTQLWIGRTFTSAQNYGSSQIGECAIYNRALTAGEVADLYRRGNGAIGRELTGQTRRRRYGFVPATGARRRRILCGDYS